LPKGGFYRVLETFSNCVLLSLLWLAACLPVVTIFPATMAMFGVTREWTRGGDLGLWRAFSFYFRQNLRQSLWLELLWAVSGAMLAANLLAIGQMQDLAKALLYPPVLLLCFLHVSTSLWLFPVVVSYDDVGWKAVLRNSLLYSVGRPLTTLGSLLIVVAAAGIVISAPISLLVVGSLASYLVFRLCDRSLMRIARRK